mmetsp:Transcript_18552/g.28853  ORF Transcript_18552/g.28853 Transcript_18552/m.28853 type:complete len:80 (+) Transcript_18552:230-469(+)
MISLEELCRRRRVYSILSVSFPLCALVDVSVCDVVLCHKSLGCPSGLGLVMVVFGFVAMVSVFWFVSGCCMMLLESMSY